MASTYTTLAGDKFTDFSYSYTGKSAGTYRRPVRTDFINRKRAKAAPRQGKTCPSCGMVRSVMNKCDCNS